MTHEEDPSRRGTNWFYLAGIAWLLLSALAFWAYYSGSAPFDTLGIPISQLVLGVLFMWVGWRRARRARQ
ncbi:MAG: hypothetical protein WBO43_08260 [Gemmatimonadota bacterium]|jgi:hypothetical protein